MTTLLLIRHGETDWNVEGRWQGQTDVPLNARGLEQAELLSLALADREITAIYSSDLARARQTAEAIAHRKGLPVHLEPRLREIDQGEWEGLLIGDIRTRYADIFNRRQEDPWTIAPPGGETTQQVRDRVLAAVEDILRRQPQGSVAIVSHGFALAVITAHYRAVPVTEVWNLFPANCEPVVLEASGTTKA